MTHKENPASVNEVPGPVSGEQKMPENMTASERDSSGLTVSIFACGGAGINIVDRFMSTTQRIVDTVVCYDTSKKNFRDNLKNVIVPSTGEGGGGLRATNADPTVRFLNNMSDTDLPISDVNIVCFSLAGATGSTLGPFLIREIEKRGGAAVAAVVGDKSSYLAAKNTVDSIATLVHLTKTIYLPVILSSNPELGNRDYADTNLCTQMQRLIELLTLNTHEIDRNDRRNWLNATRTTSVEPGLKPLFIATGVDHGPSPFCDPSQSFDSVLSIGATGIGGISYIRDIAQHARYRKEGFFTKPYANPLIGIITSNAQLINDLLKDAKATRSRYAAQPQTVQVDIDMGDDVDPITGLVQSKD